MRKHFDQHKITISDAQQYMQILLLNKYYNYFKNLILNLKHEEDNGIRSCDTKPHDNYN